MIHNCSLRTGRATQPHILQAMQTWPHHCPLLGELHFPQCSRGRPSPGWKQPDLVFLQPLPPRGSWLIGGSSSRGRCSAQLLGRPQGAECPYFPPHLNHLLPKLTLPSFQVSSCFSFSFLHLVYKYSDKGVRLSHVG